MLSIKDLKINLVESNIEIVKGVSLDFNPGEVHLLNGKNGSGKSTLVNAIMGNPQYEITAGSLELIRESISELVLSKIDQDAIVGDQIDLKELEPNEKSLLGIFLANQYPPEIPGVSLKSYLRLIFNARRAKEDQLPVFKFNKILREKAEIIRYPEHLLSRNLNEGFSGGEKKKTEILQMMVLEPRYVFLDEIDSGLDRQSVQEVFQGLVEYKKLYPDVAYIIITHYDRAQEFLNPDHIHEMSAGLLL